jgi:hypothetical protein
MDLTSEFGPTDLAVAVHDGSRPPWPDWSIRPFRKTNVGFDSSMDVANLRGLRQRGMFEIWLGFAEGDAEQ